MALAFDAKQPSKEQLTDEQSRIQREEKLLRLLKAEENDALSYAESEIQGQQIEALKRYNGEKYGDEEEGRSQVTTREVFETIEWQRNDYARVLNDGGKLIYAEEQREEHAKNARAAEDYLQWIMFVDNPGFFILDDFTFDGLLHRRGYLGAYWRTKEYRAPQTLTGLNIMQVQELMNDPEVEIIGQDFDEESEAGGIALQVKRLKSPARVEIVSFAPEDVRVTGRSTDIDSGRYLGLVWRKLRGEIMREWPDKADDVLGWSGGDAGGGGFRRAEDVRSVRFNDDSNAWDEAADDASQELEVLEEYLRADLDGDGYPELIRSYRLGDIVLEESEVEENPIGTWTYRRMPHKFMGGSVHDDTADLQRQSTVITRAGLDALYQSVVNREALDTNKVDIDSALATYSGAKVLVNGPPGDAILPLTGGLNTAAVAWEALEVIARRLEDRSGATRQTRGLDGDQLSKEHSGKALGMLQLNADARKEMTARNLAAGLSLFVGKVYRLVCRNQNEARQAKIGGKYATFDPRTWNSELKLQFHVAGLNREHSLVGIRLIGEEQEKVWETLGPGNPNVTPKHRYRYQEELCRFAGQKDCSAFFGEIPDEPVTDEQGQPVVDPQTGEPQTKPWTPEPQKDPAIVKAEMDMQRQREADEAKKQQTQMQYEKDVQLADVQQRDDMVRARNEDADKARAHELAVIEANERIAAADRTHELDMANIGLKQRELDIKERELDIKEDDLAVRRDEAQADREHEAEQNDADREAAQKAAKAKAKKAE